MKPRIVVSGVNLRKLGPLAVFQDALVSLAREHSSTHDIIALVHRKELFETAGVKYFEFPDVANSWISRLKFEFLTCHKLSKTFKPDLWLSMHDISPRVIAGSQAVYCHNPSQFYSASAKDLFFDIRFALFTMFYRYLYAINIRSNVYVIVQQDWMRDEFKRLYDVRDVIVARPISETTGHAIELRPKKDEGSYVFFYPAGARTFKNFEVCLEAMRILSQRCVVECELWLTIDESLNRYAASLKKRFASLRSVRWLGQLPREKIFDLYSRTDCLLFASRMETWGLPISEFRETGRPILAADLPYAHETGAGYGHIRFFSPNDPKELADLMIGAVKGETCFAYEPFRQPPPPAANNWNELWEFLISPIPNS